MSLDMQDHTGEGDVAGEFDMVNQASTRLALGLPGIVGRVCGCSAGHFEGIANYIGHGAYC
jgi:hypothetical protein